MNYEDLCVKPQSYLNSYKNLTSNTNDFFLKYKNDIVNFVKKYRSLILNDEIEAAKDYFLEQLNHDELVEVISSTSILLTQEEKETLAYQIHYNVVKELIKSLELKKHEALTESSFIVAESDFVECLSKEDILNNRRHFINNDGDYINKDGEVVNVEDDFDTSMAIMELDTGMYFSDFQLSATEEEREEYIKSYIESKIRLENAILEKNAPKIIIEELYEYKLDFKNTNQATLEFLKKVFNNIEVCSHKRLMNERKDIFKIDHYELDVLLSSGIPELVFSLFDESEIKAFYNQAKEFGQTTEDYLPTPQYINKHEQIIKIEDLFDYSTHIALKSSDFTDSLIEYLPKKSKETNEMKVNHDFFYFPYFHIYKENITSFINNYEEAINELQNNLSYYNQIQEDFPFVFSELNHSVNLIQEKLDDIFNEDNLKQLYTEKIKTITNIQDNKLPCIQCKDSFAVNKSGMCESCEEEHFTCKHCLEVQSVETNLLEYLNLLFNTIEPIHTYLDKSKFKKEDSTCFECFSKICILDDYFKEDSDCFKEIVSHEIAKIQLLEKEKQERLTKEKNMTVEEREKKKREEEKEFSSLVRKAKIRAEQIRTELLKKEIKEQDTSTEAFDDSFFDDLFDF